MSLIIVGERRNNSYIPKDLISDINVRPGALNIFNRIKMVSYYFCRPREHLFNDSHIHQDPVSDLNKVRSVASNIFNRIKKISVYCCHPRQYFIQNKIDKRAKDFAAARAKASSLTEKLGNETRNLSPKEISAIAHDVFIPMITELLESRKLFCKEFEKGKLDSSVVAAMDYLTTRFCDALRDSKRASQTCVVATSAPEALAAIKEEREKFESLEQAYEELEKNKS